MFGDFVFEFCQSKFAFMVVAICDQMHFTKTVSGPKVIKLFSYSTQLAMKFILLINVTIVGILTCISMINTISEKQKARNFFICQYFSFYEQLKYCAQLS